MAAVAFGGLLAIETSVVLLLAAGGEADPLSPERLLIGAGIGGVFILANWRGWLYLRPAVKDKDDEIARLRTELATLRKNYDDQTERVLEAMTDALSEVANKGVIVPKRKPRQ